LTAPISRRSLIVKAPMPEPIPVAAGNLPGLPRCPPHRTDAASEATPPVLLTMATYYGTLAAARSLGAAGIPVTIADPERFAPARWSRFVSRRVSCPSVQEPERFISWLLEFGARHPGHVLYPTGDDVAWLYALHRGELATHFRLYQPSVDVIYSLLNKERLWRACNMVGIDMPQTWFLHEGDDIGSLGHELTYPLLVKPQTQILFWPHAKGKVVRSRQALRRTYDRLVSRTSYSPALLAYDPGVMRPLLQVYLPHAAQSIYSVSGFVDESGDLFVVRASRKVLQRPRLLGTGVCFEEAEVDGPLEGKILSLCKQVGYHGVFEVEFIEEGGRFLLIDFNPRYYGQMGFDIARGLPLPSMVYEAAIGLRERLQADVDRARSEGATGGRVYCNRLELGFLLGVRRPAGAMNAADDRHWKAWLAAHEGKITDALIDPADRWPGFAHVVSQVLRCLRHPRSFLQEFRSER
jgi:predicted ATP-grasp superfamily ATP-dependent carboligase